MSQELPFKKLKIANKNAVEVTVCGDANDGDYITESSVVDIKDFVKQVLEYKPEAVYVTADLFAAYPVVHALRKKHMPVLMRAKKEGKTRIVRLPSGS